MAEAESKHKKKKSESDKKRAREEDAPSDTERKPKKPKRLKSELVSSPSKDDTDVDPNRKHKNKHERKSKHERKDKHEHTTEKRHKKHKDTAEKRHREPEAKDEALDDTEQPIALGDAEPNKHAADLHSKPRSAYQPSDMPTDAHFPFFSQTVSLYVPLYPVGWTQPVTSAEHQVLSHLRDKYVPSLRGVLLGYDNVALGPDPGRHDAAAHDDESTTLASRDAYAVGFAWITADVELFVPTRGAWMEGTVNLQTEGHIGVVCFGRFNASIEAIRLPPSWTWVSNEPADAHGSGDTASVATADDHGINGLVHSTGFWVDAAGVKVRGQVCFRIRNFDVGVSDDTSYLSLEGTMLDAQSEKRLVADEARTALVRLEKKGSYKTARARAPDFSMTRFTADDDDGASRF